MGSGRAIFAGMPACSREFTKYDFFECHFVKSTLRACSAFTKLAYLIAVFVKIIIYFLLYSIYFHLILSFYSRQLEFNHLNRVPFTKPGGKNSIFVNFRCAPTAERLNTAHLPVILTLLIAIRSHVNIVRSFFPNFYQYVIYFSFFIW